MPTKFDPPPDPSPDVTAPVDGLADALGEAAETLAGSDPWAARYAIQRARDRLDEAEGQAIRVALEKSGWRVHAAAKILGFPRHQALLKLLDPGGRHAALGAEAKERRAETGYTTGRPPNPTAADPSPPPAKVPPLGHNAPSRRGQSAPRG